MKKLLFLLSLALMTVWILGVFVYKASLGIHIFLVLSILAYIRSLMIVNDSRGLFTRNWLGK
jgi:hypothetical protein